MIHGYGAVACFIAWLAAFVYFGIRVHLFVPWFLVYPALAFVAAILALGLTENSGRSRRIVPLLLLLGCLATLPVEPWATPCVDLHIILRIYRAGGPDRVNAWAQQLLGKQERGGEHIVHIPVEDIPEEIQRYLSADVFVFETLQIEMGGGFFHYGVVVASEETALPATWWQSILGWPTEVQIYHE